LKEKFHTAYKVLIDSIVYTKRVQVLKISGFASRAELISATLRWQILEVVQEG